MVVKSRLSGFHNLTSALELASKNFVNTESKITFQPKWKELLIGTIDGKQFTIELTMGTLKVYFPAVAKWEASAPGWAKGRWEQVRVSLSSWCDEQKIPLEIEDNAWVEFD